MAENAVMTTAVYLCLLQEARCARFVQRPGGQAAADGTDGCPHVRRIREDRCRHLQSHGLESENEALKIRYVNAADL